MRIAVRERDTVIDELMNLEARGMRAGICGREWCEACGKPGSFSGFWGAFVGHSYDGRFVCGTCRSGDMARDDHTGGSMSCADYDKLDELILKRGFRYCAGCGVELPLRGESRHQLRREARRRPFTCQTCGEIEIGKAARRRYLEHEAEQPGGLERAEARLRWAQAVIDAMPPNEQE
jgi:hypothetical protein